MAESLTDSPLEAVTYADVRDFLESHVREHAGLEYKSPEYDQGGHFRFEKEFLETIVAFANSGTGLIIYGVREDKETHEPAEIVGVRRAPKGGARSRDPAVVLRDRCRSEIDPGLPLETRTIEIPESETGAGNALLVVRVRLGRLRPYFLRNVGIFVRHDDSDKVATVREIQQLLSVGVEAATPRQSGWGRVERDIFGFVTMSSQDAPVCLAVGLTPVFALEQGATSSVTDDEFRARCRAWFGNDRFVVLLPDGCVYSPALAQVPLSGDESAFRYACAYDDGSVGSRLRVGGERERLPNGGVKPEVVDLVGLWDHAARMLRVARRWPECIAQRGPGPMTFRLAVTGLTNAVAADPSSRRAEHPEVPNRLPTWQFDGEWGSLESLDDVLDSAVASLARQLQFVGYDEVRASVRERATLRRETGG